MNFPQSLLALRAPSLEEGTVTRNYTLDAFTNKTPDDCPNSVIVIESCHDICIRVEKMCLISCNSAATSEAGND